MLSREGSFPAGYVWKLLDQPELRLGNVARIDISDRSGFEVLPDGFLHQGAHLTALPGCQISKLFLYVTGKLNRHD